MSEWIAEEIHRGGLVEVGTGADDPASLAMGFDGTLLRRLFAQSSDGHRAPVGWELVFDNEDEGGLRGDLYAVYRLNDPLLKARGEVLFAGPVELVAEDGPTVMRSCGEVDIAQP